METSSSAEITSTTSGLRGRTVNLSRQGSFDDDVSSMGTSLGNQSLSISPNIVFGVENMEIVHPHPSGAARPPPVQPRKHPFDNSDEHSTVLLNAPEKPQRAAFCVPYWIADASPWLKSLLVFSLSLLVASMVLVTAVLAMGGSDNSDKSTTSSFTEDSKTEPIEISTRGDDVGFEGSGFEIIFPSTSSPITLPKTVSGNGNNETSTPSISPTMSPTILPTSAPSRTRTNVPSSSRSISPSSNPSKSELPTFSTPTEPTVAPSKAPTTAHPSTQPSKGPSQYLSSATPSSEEQTQAPSEYATESPSSGPVVDTTSTPSYVPSALTSEPTSEPSLVPSLIPSSKPSSEPTSILSIYPTAQPTQNPTVEPSISPTALIIETTFYVMGGDYANYGDNKLKQNLQKLPADDEQWLVHLGGFRRKRNTDCSLQVYKDFTDLYTSSSVPVYVTPGDQDYRPCDEPDQAFGFLMDQVVGYETEYWSPPKRPVVKRQQDRNENFAFVFRKTLYIGVHVVGEDDQSDENEWKSRLSDDLRWVEDNYAEYKNDINGIVIFGHKGRTNDVNENFFFKPLSAKIAAWGKETVYVWLTTSQMEVRTNTFRLPNFTVVRVKASKWPPLQVTVDTSDSTMKISVNQNNWFRNLPV